MVLRSKKTRRRSFKCIALFSAALAILISASCSAAPAQWPEIAPRFKPVAEKIVSQLDEKPKPIDNLTGGIAWGVSYEMDAFLEMYRATGDESYLDDFVKEGDAVIAARADVIGQPDWKGDLRRGWLTGAHYTLGVPFILEDKSGKPVLQIQTVANAGNNQTKIEVVPAPDNRTFTLIVSNDFRRTEPKIETYENLTPATAEEKVNAALGKATLVRVKELSDSIPRAYAPFTPPVGLVVLHGHHTGRIASPLAQFAALVKNNPKLQRFAPAAAKYLQSAEEAIADMNGDWREDGEIGYFNFEKAFRFGRTAYPNRSTCRPRPAALISTYSMRPAILYIVNALKNWRA